jgi:hypothetical protein
MTHTTFIVAGSALAVAGAAALLRDQRAQAEPVPAGDFGPLVAPALLAAPGPGWTKDDYAKVVGNDRCAECHKNEVQAWSLTHHATTWNNMHKSERAQQISAAMGIEDIKSDGMCMNCHYTSKMDAGEITPIAGVSCESCHGPAKDWIVLHNDYGAGATKETEAAAHRDERHAKADAAGMIRKDRIDLIAANCFGCHTVPNEELVNKGGHPAGSADFDLVAWSQGEVRHNYAESTDGKNRPATQERKRVLYVTGAIVDLEMSIRGASKITAKGPYRDMVLGRVRTATAKVDAILKAAPIAELSSVIAPLERDDKGAIKMTKALLGTLPDQLAAASKAFVAAHGDGAGLEAIDPLIPTPDKYKGTAKE